MDVLIAPTRRTLVTFHITVVLAATARNYLQKLVIRKLTFQDNNAGPTDTRKPGQIRQVILNFIAQPCPLRESYMSLSTDLEEEVLGFDQSVSFVSSCLIDGS